MGYYTWEEAIESNDIDLSSNMLFLRETIESQPFGKFPYLFDIVSIQVCLTHCWFPATPLSLSSAHGILKLFKNSVLINYIKRQQAVD